MRAVFVRRECLMCGLCCMGTEMILLKEDVERIESLGFSRASFTYFDGRYWRLRNVEGHCYFYDPATGLCRIYPNRPAGCRIYPVIWVEGEGPALDPDCPLAETITKEEWREGVKEIKEYVRKLKREYG